MDHESFRSINLETRADFVFGYGEYISSIDYYGRKVDLYVVGKFYVEAFYNIETEELEDIAILESSEKRLQLYSKSVDIEDLFE